MGKLAIVTLSVDIGFARKSSKSPRTLASFSRAGVPRSAYTRDVTCELYCNCSRMARVSKTEIQGSSHEMAVTVGNSEYFDNDESSIEFTSEMTVLVGSCQFR